MKTLPAEILEARQSRAGTMAHSLIYITSKNRDTGDPESLGFWSGAINRSFTVPISGGSESRVYYGAGNVLATPDISYTSGVEVNKYSITLTGLTAEVRQILRTYNARFAPIEMHRAEFSLTNAQLLAPPQRLFKGWIDGIMWEDSGENGELTATLQCVDNTRALTRKLSTMFSDASQKLRDPADNFNRYTDVSGTADVFWGTERAVSKQTVATIARKHLKMGSNG